MKLDIIFHYEVNTETGEIIYIGKDEVTVDTKKTTTTKKSSIKVDDNKEPLVTLDSNKLIFTQGAAELLQVDEDCRIDIKYKKKDKLNVPVIGTDKSFGTKGGNKITQKLTVSYRGAANEKLSTFGTVFKLEPTDKEGIFYLIGDKEPEITKVPEEITNIESDLDINILDELDIETDNVVNFDFKL